MFVLDEMYVEGVKLVKVCNNVEKHSGTTSKGPHKSPQKKDLKLSKTLPGQSPLTDPTKDRRSTNGPWSRSRLGTHALDSY